MKKASNDTENLELPDRRWQEMCTHIRTTDEISFKLLGAVPLVSAAGIAASVLTTDVRFTPVFVLFCLFAAGVTLALWIWERRNIQTCLWVRERAAKLEKQTFGDMPGHFCAFPDAPGRKGKTIAEKIVYGLTIGSWLLLPGAILATAPQKAAVNNSLCMVYVYIFAAICLGVVAITALCTEITIEPGKFPTD